MLESDGQLPVSAVVELTSAILPAVAFILIEPVAEAVGRSALVDPPDASLIKKY